jgi:hypothetical protein
VLINLLSTIKKIMENLVWIPTNSKKAMEEELLRGRDMANQVLEVLSFDDMSNIIREIKGSNLKSTSSSKLLPLSVAEDLVREVLKSFTNTILLLNNNQESIDVAIPITVGDVFCQQIATSWRRRI